jgi:hypothetical protein
MIALRHVLLPFPARLGVGGARGGQIPFGLLYKFDGSGKIRLNLADVVIQGGQQRLQLSEASGVARLNLLLAIRTKLFRGRGALLGQAIVFGTGILNVALHGSVFGAQVGRSINRSLMFARERSNSLRGGGGGTVCNLHLGIPVDCAFGQCLE